MSLLQASLMCARLGHLAEDTLRLEAAGIDAFHFDIMDGHFVPNIALGPATLAALRPITRLPFHAHLMTERPEDQVEALAIAGCNCVAFHLEATRNPFRLVDRIHSLGMDAALAVSPSTPVEAVPGITGLAYVLVMLVEPGFAGQRAIPGSTARAAAIRSRLSTEVRLAIDGNVTVELATAATGAGVSMFVLGTSGLFRGDSEFRSAIERFRAALTGPRIAPIVPGSH